MWVFVDGRKVKQDEGRMLIDHKNKKMKYDTMGERQYLLRRGCTIK